MQQLLLGRQDSMKFPVQKKTKFGIQEYKLLDMVPQDHTTKHSKEGIPIPSKCPDCSSSQTQLTYYNSQYDWSVECLGCNTVIENVIVDGKINPKYKQWVRF